MHSFRTYSRRSTSTQYPSQTSGRDADAQRLSRLRRAHSAFRAYGVPYESKPLFVLLSSPQRKLCGSKRIPLQKQKRGKPRFLHGQLKTAADAWRPSRLRRSLRKQTAIRPALRSTEEALRKQANRFAKAREKKSTLPTPHLENRGGRTASLSPTVGT